MWDGKQIVSKDWVVQSVAPFIDAEEGYKYGFQWWLLPGRDAQHYVWMARGFGGQFLMIFPAEDLIVVFTGWDIPAEKDTRDENPEFISRILKAVGAQACGGATH